VPVCLLQPPDITYSHPTIALRLCRARDSCPRELPPNVAFFVGREQETAQVKRMILQSRRSRQHRAAVVVFHGPGGSGKSALAVHLAHELANEFPDGQLYVDLQGSTPGLRPLSPVDVLHRLLGSLGVPDGDIPQDASDAAARFRTITATDRRLLILLDNAHDAHQLSAFLPAGDASAVLVTSRRPLGALEADRRFRLGGLPAADGYTLLRRLAENVAVDRVSAARIVELCDYLPLALRIVAGRLSSVRAVSLKDFAERLADRRRRLDELVLDGLAVRSCVGVGYEALVYSDSCIPRLAGRVFRLLGLLNVRDFQPELVAAMLGDSNVSMTRAALDHLVSAGLVEPLPSDRYGFHDLIRLVAAERAAEEEAADAGAGALHRGLAYYAGALRRADRLLQPGRISAVGEPSLPAGVTLPDFTTPHPARIWVDAELRSLVAAMEQAIGLPNGVRTVALFIGEPLWEYLYRRHDWNTARRLGELALGAAQQCGDSAMAAWAHVAVGRSAADFCEWDTAVLHFNRARSLYAEMGNHVGIVLALNSLGVAADFRGDADSANRYLTECLGLVRCHEMRGAEGVVLLNLSSVYAVLGRWSEALQAAERSLTIRRGLGNSAAVSSALRALASIQCLEGDLLEAARCADEAITLIRYEGDQVREHYGLLTRCEVSMRRGSHAKAIADADAALALARQRNDRYTEALALHQMSRVFEARGDRQRSAELQAEAGAVRAAVRTRRDTLLELLLQAADAETQDSAGAKD
jgi:tetratricopeptide (TPR) repeat protein/DNA polymerase III delta prime subunit